MVNVVESPAAVTLPISEVFGPTLQGEGPYAGRAVQFIRLGGCNLSCTWCDTFYTWDGSRVDLREEITPTHARDIVHRLIPRVPIVLSGGEPLLHQNNLGLWYVLSSAHQLGCAVHVETNGTLAPNSTMLKEVDVFAVSPKLSHAGPHRGSQNPALHESWPGLARRNHDVVMKVVVRDRLDVAEAVTWADLVGWPRPQVWVMPLGTTSGELLGRWREIADAACDAKINASQRLHVLAWGDCKGT